jgi:hypothetical protein
MTMPIRMRAALVVLPIAVALWAGRADSARTSVARDFPVYDNDGYPDLTIDPQRFTAQMEIIDRYFDPVDDACVFDEFAVGGIGYRRLLRFDTVIMNSGDGDLVVGDRSDPDNEYADYFYLAECHGHYHIRDFSIYQLLTLDGREVVRGEKQGFCMEDSFKYDGDNDSNGYNCEFQGITSGWGDWYYKQLAGQWIDITGVPEGDYIVRASINGGPRKQDRIFAEGQDRYPNFVQVEIHVPDPRNKVDGSP